MKISKSHNNRRYYNWLIYNINDSFLENHSSYYKGNLYDLGCGEAPYKDFFLKFADKYIGVDWTKTFHNSQADIISDLNKKIELDDKIADTIISISVLEHLCEPQIFLNECNRILKNNGHLILQVPFQWWIHEAPHDYFRYTPHGLKYILKKAGFTNIEVKAQSGFFSMWILKINYFSTKLIKGPKLIKFLIKNLLIPFWFIGQILAPQLDKIDKNWDNETTSYFVIAKK